jgi:hypothetical protein
MGSETGSKRKFAIAGAVAFAVVASVAAIGIPAGWYGGAKASTVASQPNTAAPTTQPASPVAEVPKSEPEATTETPTDHGDEAALALKRQREKEKAKAREEKAAALTQAGAPAPAPAASDAVKSGPKKITVTVSYDESGRVTQASGGDASAVRIARQKRFPAGKAGSATITIPIN